MVVATPSFLIGSIQSLQWPGRTKSVNIECLPMDEGRKRVLGIIAGILVVRDLKTSEDLIETRSIPRTESIIAATVQRAERITRKIDNVFGA